MAEPQSTKDRIKEITAGIEQGIMELFETDRYRSYLTTMSRFHRYSLNNVMLIHAQRPDATLVAGFNKWKNSFGRHVKRGEKGIQILAPTPYKIKVEKEKLDPDTRMPMLDQDGNTITEEKEVTIPMYKIVNVFDVSQTDGRPLPQLATTLTGDVAQYEVFLEALRRTSPVPIAIQPIADDTDGFFNLDTQSITLREGMSQVQTICAGVHEIAHAKLHNYEKMTELADDGKTVLSPDEKDRNTEEVEAESISYAVCQYFGIETADNSFGYIATWSKGKELKELRNSLETINKTSSELITSIEEHFQEICKERGIDLSTSQLTAPDVPASPEINSKAVNSFTDSTRDFAKYSPLPDPTITPQMMGYFGYTDSDMLPLSKDRAMELVEKDITVYMLYADNTEEMVFDAEDVVNHDSLFGITREEWEAVRADIPPRDVAQRFLNSPTDSMVIYQLNRDAPVELRFAGLEKLNAPPDPANYEAIYTREVYPDSDTSRILENFYYIFNEERPADFTGHSLSVSDIVALKLDGKVSYHYCDSVGFKELPAFQRPENYLKAAEMSMEDDYGMIDGINPEESVIPKKSCKRRRRDEFCL